MLSQEVLFSSLLRSSSSCSSSLMLSSRTLGQKSPSKYGSSLALVSRSSVACLKMSCRTGEDGVYKRRWRRTSDFGLLGAGPLCVGAGPCVWGRAPVCGGH